ncbi:MAG: hypothetical protein RRZ67_00940 [Victivallaceae bacterium]
MSKNLLIYLTQTFLRKHFTDIHQQTFFKRKINSETNISGGFPDNTFHIIFSAFS